MKAERRGNVLQVRLDVKPGWEQWLMLRSDAHHDSVHCNRALEEAHLRKAAERNALILDGGDLFDAMQGRFDPRRSYEGIRPEYLADGRYYDNITDDLFAFYRPYAGRFLLLARGNHEKSVLKNAQTDITDRLVYRLNHEAGGQVWGGGYGGWVRFLFADESGPRGSLNMKYFHGAGGEAPVTRGVIQTNRQAVYLPDADVVWNGHNHNDYVLNIKRERLTMRGVLFMDLQTHVRTPGYQDSYGDGSGGWEVERGGVPKPQGCAWIRLWFENHTVRREVCADVA